MKLRVRILLFAAVRRARRYMLMGIFRKITDNYVGELLSTLDICADRTREIMSNDNKLLEYIYEQLPEPGRLKLDKIHYNEKKRHVTVFLLSDEPVREENFLNIKKALKKLLPGMAVSLRTASPNSAQHF